jgi:hypothetical protein
VPEGPHLRDHFDLQATRRRDQNRSIYLLQRSQIRKVDPQRRTDVPEEEAMITEVENARLRETLLDVLTQACHESGGLFDTGALSAYRDGWELAVELGIAERDGDLVGRRGFYRPRWDCIERAW